MAKGSNRSPPDKDVAAAGAEEPDAERADTERADTVPPSLVDPYVAFADPVRPVETEKLKGRAVVDILPRRDVEELNRALDQATGAAESVVVTVKLSPREYRRLRQQAEASGETEQMLLREALFEYLDRRGL